VSNRYFRADAAGKLYELHRPVPGFFRTLLGSGESIADLIDRHIEKFPPDRTSFRANVTVQKDVATLAVGLRVLDKDGKGTWSVMLGAEFRKDGASAARFEFIRES
jgi:hypothetical protein